MGDDWAPVYVCLGIDTRVGGAGQKGPMGRDIIGPQGCPGNHEAIDWWKGKTWKEGVSVNLV